MIVGTRGSKLALTQTNYINKCLFNITKIRFIENSEEKNKMLVISCVDNNIYFVKLPLKWLDNEEIETYEQVEIKNRSDLKQRLNVPERMK